MPGKRKDSVGNMASQGCVKCCAYCRVSPHGAALCYGSLGLGLVTVFVYLLSSGLTPAADDRNNKGECSVNVPFTIGNGSAREVYANYLKYTGLAVFLLMVAVILCGCVCCGLLCGFPRPVKLVALVCFIPMALFFLFYFAWLAVGTYLLTQINGAQYGNDVICRNILVFMIALWFYFFCLFVVAILIIVWKLCSLKKSKGRRKKDDQLLAGIV